MNYQLKYWLTEYQLHFLKRLNYLNALITSLMLIVPFIIIFTFQLITNSQLFIKLLMVAYGIMICTIGFTVIMYLHIYRIIKCSQLLKDSIK